MWQSLVRRRTLAVGLALLALVLAGCVMATPTATPEPEAAATPEPVATLPEGDAARGQYVFAVALGCGCHQGSAGFLAGGEVFSGPFGTVYVRNITQDAATGIGDWTDQQIADAIRTGHRPDGEMLFPIMPYPIYSGMADQDVADLVAFLRTVEPVANDVPARELNVPVPPFEPLAPPPATAPTEGVARGEYLVRNVADCSGCHTTRNADGTPDMTRFLAGDDSDPDMGPVPNITPHETGIGDWTAEDIATLLKTGFKPDGEEVGGSMSFVVQLGTSNLTDEDALAIGEFLKTIPAVESEE